MTDAWKQWEGEVVDGRFPLHRFLGRSDHSAVFLTEYGQPSQKAALKFVEANAATAPRLLSRWERAAKLSHPHLIRLVQSGRCELGGVSMLYVVTEFADENLSQILLARALGPKETEYMLRSVLEVLAYLHSQGLVHGRVKPSNVLAVGDQLKISIDGVCGRGEKSLIGLSTIYDPPELASTGLFPAGDVWSLGITLVEALTQRPSAGEAIRQADPSLPETVPAPFLEIARQCLRLDPQRRWSVPDIAAHLLPTLPAPAKNSYLRYLLPVGVVVFALTAFIAGPRFLSPRSEPPRNAPGDTAPGSAPVSPPAQSTTSAPAPQSPTEAENTQKPIDAVTQVAHPADPVSQPHTPVAASISTLGAVAHEVVPPVSPRTRGTITGKVRVGVRVAVDAKGNVVEAQFESAGPSAYFANLALESSRRWKFQPPQANGAAVPSEWILRYEFGRGGTEVHSSMVTPPK